MNRVKNLSIPTITALMACLTIPASAQLEFTLSADSAYRHQRKNGNKLNFTGATLKSRVQDGDFVDIGACAEFFYEAPVASDFLCTTIGTNGFLQSAAAGEPPYRVVTGITPGIALEPFQPDSLELVAAPPTKLSLPLGGFKDASRSLLFSLHLTPQQYVFAEYDTARNYKRSQQTKYKSEVVTGIYVYDVPRIGRPDEPFQMFPRLFPIVEGISKKNGQTSGFDFDIPAGSKWSKQGFLEVSSRFPTTFKWSGLTVNNVLGAADDLLFSVKAIANSENPNSAVVQGVRTTPDLFGGETVIRDGSIFPGFATAANPQVLLPTPITSQFTLPPVLKSGTKGVVQLELRRDLQTSSVTADESNSKFELPIVAVDRYSDFRKTLISKKKSQRSSLLGDADGDGVNNLTEWILDSGPTSANSIPVAPIPTLKTDIIESISNSTFVFFDPSFGFVIDKKLSTVPKVNYQLQRSQDNGITWEDFNDGQYFNGTTLQWTVSTVSFTAAGALREEIRVIAPGTAAPLGTEDDIYRVKITRK
jgi:hypothetical protein